LLFEGWKVIWASSFFKAEEKPSAKSWTSSADEKVQSGLPPNSLRDTGISFLKYLAARLDKSLKMGAVLPYNEDK
jgi:hypothetical protein